MQPPQPSQNAHQHRYYTLKYIVMYRKHSQLGEQQMKYQAEVDND